MAKRRGRPVSLDGLMAELRFLDAKRKQLVANIQDVVSSVVGAGAVPARRVRSVGSTKAASPRKRRRMSATARAKIAAAQKARWAKVRARKKQA